MRQFEMHPIHVEFFGILFDVVVLVLLFNWINSLGERKREVRRHEEVIDDFRYWRSDEAKFRIIGSMKRLNDLNCTKMNLINVDIEMPNNGKQQFKLPNMKFNGSRFLKSNFSNLSMPNSKFNNIVDHYSTFHKSILLNAEFIDCHLQGTNFTKTGLLNAKFCNSVLTDDTDFSHSEMRSANFDNVTIDSANFEGAEVNEDFFDRMKEWNIKGNNVFLDYKILKYEQKPGVFVHLLKKFR